MAKAHCLEKLFIFLKSFEQLTLFSNNIYYFNTFLSVTSLHIALLLEQFRQDLLCLQQFHPTQNLLHPYPHIKTNQCLTNINRCLTNIS